MSGRNHTSVVMEANVGSCGDQLDFSSSEVSQAIENVQTPGSSTRWVVLGYEGNSNKLKVAETCGRASRPRHQRASLVAQAACPAAPAHHPSASTGDGLLEDMVEELNPGKVLYAYWRAVDTSAPKFLYVSWVGEGAPATIKSKANGHSPIVARQVVKRIHVSINARDADDLDEAAVMKKIQTASGANYDAGSIRE